MQQEHIVSLGRPSVFAVPQADRSSADALGVGQQSGAVKGGQGARHHQAVLDAAGDDAPRLLPNLMCGEEGIESTEPTRQILRMAAICRQSPGLQAALALPDAVNRLWQSPGEPA